MRVGGGQTIASDYSTAYDQGKSHRGGRLHWAVGGRSEAHGGTVPIEVEVEDLAELQQAIDAGADMRCWMNSAAGDARGGAQNARAKRPLKSRRPVESPPNHPRNRGNRCGLHFSSAHHKQFVPSIVDAIRSASISNVRSIDGWSDTVRGLQHALRLEDAIALRVVHAQALQHVDDFLILGEFGDGLFAVKWPISSIERTISRSMGSCRISLTKLPSIFR